MSLNGRSTVISSFQFLGIPPKGEHFTLGYVTQYVRHINCFQFLGIPPKGEHNYPSYSYTIFDVSNF